MKTYKLITFDTNISAIYSKGAEDALASPEKGGTGKGQSLISAHGSLAITTNTPGFKKLSTALSIYKELKNKITL